MAHDVFISHSVKDKTTADAMCAMLESEGIRCWIAPRDVTPGMEWGKCIIDAIRHARIMVLVFTANANASQQIRREVERAVHHDVIILPFRVENVVPDESLEYFIGNVHWLDALTPPLEAHLKNLSGTIKMLLGRMPLREEQPWPRPLVSPAVATVPEPSPPSPQAAPQTIPEKQQEPKESSQPISPELTQQAAEPVLTGQVAAEAQSPSIAAEPALSSREPEVGSGTPVSSATEALQGVPKQELPAKARKSAIRRVWLPLAIGIVVFICINLFPGYRNGGMGMSTDVKEGVLAVLLCACLALYYGLRPRISAQWGVAAEGPTEDLGKLYRVGRMLLMLSLIGVGLSCGLLTLRLYVFNHISRLIDVVLIASMLGFLVLRRIRAWGVMLGLIALNLLCGYFFEHQLHGQLPLPAIAARVALIGAVLMVAGLELRRRVGPNLWFRAGRLIFAAGALACILGGGLRGVLGRGFLEADISPLGVLNPNSRLFDLIWWWNPFAFVFGPLTALGSAFIFFRRVARAGAICVAAANILFLPLIFVYYFDDFCGGTLWTQVWLLLGWGLNLGVAGGALVIAAAFRETRPEGDARSQWLARLRDIFYGRLRVRIAAWIAAVALFAAIVFHGLIPFFFYEANSRGEAELGDLTTRVYAATSAPWLSGQIMTAGLAGRSCAAGNADGCSNFARFYEEIGWNWGRADRLLAKAAALITDQCDRGSADACANLGALYGEGNGVARDVAHAVALYERACDGNSSSGCEHLAQAYAQGALSYAEDPAKAVALCTKACKIQPGGDCGAMFYQLGNTYMVDRGVPRDLGKAGELYKQSCESGYSWGCSELSDVAYAFAEGKDVTRSYVKSAAFYASACNGGIAAACTNLGIQYDNGEGVARDLSKAAELYQKACDGSDEQGCSNLGSDYWYGDGVAQDKAKGITLLKKGCDMGNQWGCDRLKELQK
jgi:hypothetical protein